MAVQAPAELRASYRDWDWSLFWDQYAEVSTWRLEHADGRVCFVKVSKAGQWVSRQDECERLRWSKPYLPVPEVLDCGSDSETEWLVSVELPGIDATRHPLRSDPAQLVRALAIGLARFHESAPVGECPFDFQLDTALARVRRRVEEGRIDAAEDFNDDHAHLTLEEALTFLEQKRPTDEDLVVCHGDYCPPNVLLDRDGLITGYLDVGELGVADRWWDVAVGAWAATWNYGPGHEDLFYAAYGIQRDDERIAFYRLLYDLTS